MATRHMRLFAPRYASLYSDPEWSGPGWRDAIRGYVIREGDQWPARWGMSYREAGGMRAVCHPVPLNLLVGWSRWLWFWVKNGVAPHSLDLAEKRAEYYRRKAHKTCP